MSTSVLVTGVGITSALGIGIHDNHQALLAERSGIGQINLLNTIHRDSLPAGEVQYADQELVERCQLPGTAKDHSRTTLLGLLAAREALDGLDGENVRTGLISANSVGGMGYTELYYPQFMNGEFSNEISVMAQHDCGESTEVIASLLGIKDYVTTISTACSSSANSIMLGARLIKMGLVDRVVAGGADALTKFTLNGFNSLQILDHAPCRPFDESRKGLNLGEGAGYVVLESEQLAMTHPEKIIALLSGYGNANDAFHQTASSPDGIGAGLAIEKALKVSGLAPQAIDYINVHGTGTENNDLSEGLALERIFNKQLPLYSSTKAFTGHTLGAAGGIEAVISILALQHNQAFANLHHSTQMSEFEHRPVTRNTSIEINHVLSNSFGFGGNCSSLIFSKYQA